VLVPEGDCRRHTGLRVHRGRLLAIVLAGLPPPVLQHPVGPYFLDMAHPELMLGIEHDGREHLKPDRALRDLTREGYLGRRGWDVLAFRPVTSTSAVGSLRRSHGRSPRSGDVSAREGPWRPGHHDHST
jgi:hypothetical protein